ncbi:hypothetical protein FQN54_003662 [Arachnomyces sp. PD_36]|nr:hypothetical protein FQN54_003662 [Arachnomyces sp. PD_36]
MQNTSLESRIAYLVHTQFDALPKQSKPCIRGNGVKEWIPMSGIVLACHEDTPEETLTCVAVTTGAKCLSASQMPQSQGLILHDSHAEILALRAFNYWLIRECRSILAWEKERRDHDTPNPESGDCEKYLTSPSPFVKRRTPPSTTTVWPPFELRKEVRVYMYCTCAPCGDASMELCMASQDDPTPWQIPSGHAATNDTTEASISKKNLPQLLDGRAHFSVLGVVRRKPSRADAEATISKSCSDKLALKQITSLLSFPTSLLVAPTQNAYLAGLILPEEEISRTGCERAFGGGENGRLRSFSGRKWSYGNELSYRYLPFSVKSVPTDEVEAQWDFGKPKKSSEPTTGENAPISTAPKSKPGNISAVWIPAPSWSPSSSPTDPKGAKVSKPAIHMKELNETLLNGVKQGFHFSAPSPRKASVLSRARMWELLRETILEINPALAEVVSDHEHGLSTPTATGTPLNHVLASRLYEDLKRGFPEDLQEGMLRERVSQDAKDIMGNWVRNRGDEGWGVEVLRESGKVHRKKVK